MSLSLSEFNRLQPNIFSNKMCKMSSAIQGSFLGERRRLGPKGPKFYPVFRWRKNSLQIPEKLVPNCCFLWGKHGKTQRESWVDSGFWEIDWMRILPSPTSFGKMDLHPDLLPGIWTWPKDLQLWMKWTWMWRWGLPGIYGDGLHLWSFDRVYIDYNKSNLRCLLKVLLVKLTKTTTKKLTGWVYRSKKNILVVVSNIFWIFSPPKHWGRIPMLYLYVSKGIQTT